MTIPELEKDIEAIWGSPSRAQAIALIVNILKDHETEIEKLKPHPLRTIRRPLPYMMSPDEYRNNIHALPNLPMNCRFLRIGEKIDDRCYYCCQGDEEWTKCDNWIWPKENLFYCRPGFTHGLGV